MRMFGILLAILIVSTGLASAQTGRWDDSFDFSKVRLVAAKQTLDDTNQVQLGLEFDVADGWNIYWRSPGPVGLPPEITWTDLSNITDTQVHWPVPDRYTYKLPGEETGIESMVYRGNTILPITLTVANPDQPLIATGNVQYMVCNDQCIFGSANVRLDLFSGDADAALSEHAPRINMFLSQVPTVAATAMDVNENASRDTTVAGLSLASHSFDADASVLNFDLRSLVPLSAPDIFIETSVEDAGFVFGRPLITLAENGMSAQVQVPVQEVAYNGATPDTTQLRITLIDGKRGVDLGFLDIGSDQGVTVTATGMTTPGVGQSAIALSAAQGGFGPEGWALAGLILAAIAAGIILNFMPCVLPVLSLKMMAFVGKADQNNREIRTSFLATAAGIIVSFWVLAGLVVLLKTFGLSVGWGFQFQSPWFVSIMAAIMVVFAANMFGWFELPNIPGLGAVGAGKRGPMADFSTGALATLLATPCSAPLLAPVIGVAFAGNALTIFGLFTLIGIGMAAPYWLVVLFPAIARMMPRPGAWMMMLKAVLGLLLLGFALFMIWVLMTQLGAWVASLALALSAGILAVLFALKGRAVTIWPALAGFVALSLVPIASATILPNQQFAWLIGDGEQKAGDIQWQEFDQAQIASLVAQGKTVFVDVTASWCVNCKFNKAVALDPQPVRSQFDARDDLVAMKADWTNHDPDIGAYLAQFKRAGIPFNVVYSPANPGGQVLPTALTQEIVLAALDS